MHTQLVLLLGMAIILVMAVKQPPTRPKPRWLQHLKGSQKLVGLVAFLGVLLIVANPEFLALGLLGDTVFFDMLVLALTLQMHRFVVRIWQRCVAVVGESARFLGIPSPGFCYLLAVSAAFVSGRSRSLRNIGRSTYCE